MPAVTNKQQERGALNHGVWQQHANKHTAFARLSGAFALSLWTVCSTFAQSFPVKDKPVTIVVPFTAGGPTDRLARDMAEALRKPLGVGSIVVENVLGAGGAIATQKVARAAPDGHTILIHHIGMATMPALTMPSSKPNLTMCEMPLVLRTVSMLC
jgi:tripartite-type tricarboxylate transporter receptor subunit TctC